jgi:hypothetical protein
MGARRNFSRRAKWAYLATQKFDAFLTARRNIVPRAVYVIAQIPGGRTGGRAGGRTETKLSSSNSAKTVRDRRLVSMEH